MSDSENPKKNRNLPHIKKDGTVHASGGFGPVKYTPVKAPLDLEEAKNRGLVPESGLNFDPDDPTSLATMGYRKFGPEQQRTYLEHLSKTGRHKLAAMLAGVTPDCVSRHVKANPEFAKLRENTLDLYHEMTSALILAQAREGMKDIKYDKEGNITSIRTSYETQIRKLMLTRADPTYQETQKSEVAVTGGAVIVPAPVESVDSWEATVAKYTGKTIDTEGGPMPGNELAAGPSADNKE